MSRFIVESAAHDSRGLEPFEYDATDADDAARQALAQGRFPVHVRAVGSGWNEVWRQWAQPSIRLLLADLAMFSEQLAQLLSSGIPLEQALALLARSSSRELPAPKTGAWAARPAPLSRSTTATPLRGLDMRERNVARFAARLLARVREGAALSAALRLEANIPAAYSGVVQGAEQAGALAAGLAALADSLQRQSETRQRVRSALAYPFALAIAAVSAALFVLTAVIPEFAPLFEGEERRLPALTRAVLWLSGLVNGRVIWLMFGAMALFLACWTAWHFWPVLRAGVWLFLRHFAPVRYVVRLDLAQSLRVFGGLLDSGMDAAAAMHLASQAATIEEIQRAFEVGSKQLREGAGLTQVCAGLPELPEASLMVLIVGERVAQPGGAAKRAAHWIDQDTQRRLAALLAVLNPLAIIGMGVLVALLIAAVMVGILSINQLAIQ